MIDRISTRHSYKTFPYKDLVSKEQYDLIRLTASKHRVQKLKEGLEIQLTSRIGTLLLVKFKPSPNKRAIDFGYFRKTGKVVSHINMATDQYVWRTMWDKSKAYLSNKAFWRFRLNTNIKKGKPDSIVEYVKKNGLEHFQETIFKNYESN